MQFGQRLSAALGGTALVAFAGLLVAGFVVGELGLLSSLSAALVPLLPIARFGGIAWLIAAAATLRARTPASAAS